MEDNKIAVVHSSYLLLVMLSFTLQQPDWTVVSQKSQMKRVAFLLLIYQFLFPFLVFIQ